MQIFQSPRPITIPATGEAVYDQWRILQITQNQSVGKQPATMTVILRRCRTLKDNVVDDMSQMQQDMINQSLPDGTSFISRDLVYTVGDLFDAASKDPVVQATLDARGAEIQEAIVKLDVDAVPDLADPEP